MQYVVFFAVVELVVDPIATSQSVLGVTATYPLSNVRAPASTLACGLTGPTDGL